MGINLGNPLLVTGKADNGDPVGLAPDVGRAIAIWIGVDVQYVTFPTPSALAEQVGRNSWDIALIADEPARAERISFTAPYVEIPATYMVRHESGMWCASQIDQSGTTVGTITGAAFELYLSRTLKHAELLRYSDERELLQDFENGRIDAVAGLRIKLDERSQDTMGLRVLSGDFTAIKQAVGVVRGNPAFDSLSVLIERMKADGHIGRSIDVHGVTGLTVPTVVQSDP